MSRRPVRVIRQISLGAAGLLSLALGAGLVYEQWSRWNVARVYPPPGDLVEFDGARSQLHDPDAVVTAIEDVVTAVRDGTRVRGATVAAVHEGTPVRKAALHPRAGAGPGRGYRSSHPGSSPPSSRQVSLAAAMSRPPEAP
jgi:hypothetical protein